MNFENFKSKDLTISLVSPYSCLHAEQEDGGFRSLKQTNGQLRSLLQVSVKVVHVILIVQFLPLYGLFSFAMMPTQG